MRSAIDYWVKLDDSGRVLCVGAIEEYDLDMRGMRREKAEVYTDRS
jgi:hypothetical protein